MSKVTVTELQKGGSIASADVNSTVQSWLSASTGVNEDNVRIEGCERRNFAMEAVTEDHLALSQSVRAYASDSEHWVESTVWKMVQTGTQASPNSGPRAYLFVDTCDLEDDENIVIHCSFDYRTTNLNGTQNEPFWYFRLSHSALNSGAGRLNIPSTIRQIGHNLMSGTVTPQSPNMAGSISITTIIDKSKAQSMAFPVSGRHYIFLDAKGFQQLGPSSLLDPPIRIFNINMHYRRFKR